MNNVDATVFSYNDYAVLVDELVEVMQNVATVGWLDETDIWGHPDRVYDAINVIAKSRMEFQKLKRNVVQIYHSSHICWIYAII